MAVETWMWLAAGLGYGAVNTGDLLAEYPGGAEEIAADLGGDRLDELLTQKQAEKLASSRPADFQLTLSRAEGMGVTALGFDDEQYPDLLRSISNPPPVIYVKGDLELMNGQLSVGIVGARRPSAYGVEATKAIGRGIALGGAIIVSGLAAGLDSEAHKAAIAVNGPTIACIGFGHDTCYPASNRKLMEVIERYGAVVSEYPVGTKPEKPYFLQRNRLIAGLSHALLVAEARKMSGTMSTVNFATDYGRDVFAVPGSIFSELSGGTNAMIREGAYLAASATDVLSLYGIELEGEDPVAAAAKQAAEGRPVAAQVEQGQPSVGRVQPWKENMGRRAHHDTLPQYVDQSAADMTLGEVLQNNTRQGDGGRVSSSQAINAFRQLQQTLPPDDDSEIDARNQMLDEMVSAVNDSVDIRTAGGRRGPSDSKPMLPKEMLNPERSDGKRVRMFNWDNVEHLDRKGIERSKAVSPNGPSERKAERSTPVRSRESRETRSAAIRRLAPVEPVGGLTPVEPVMPVSPAVPVQETEFTPLFPGQAVGTPAEQAITPSGNLESMAAADDMVSTSAAQTGEDLSGNRSFLGIRRTPKPAPDAVTMSSFAGGGRQTRPQARTPSGSALSGKLRTLQGGTSPTAPPPRQERKNEKVDRVDFQTTETVEDIRLKGLGENARLAYKQLGPTPTTLNKICEGSGLSPGEAMAALTELELVGLSRQLAGRQFVIMQ